MLLCLCWALFSEVNSQGPFPGLKSLPPIEQAAQISPRLRSLPQDFALSSTSNLRAWKHFLKYVFSGELRRNDTNS